MQRIFIAVALLAVSASAVEGQTTIDFEGTGAPCLFGQTVPLTTQYGSLNVTFSGHGSVLNQCSNFPTTTAHSGTDFVGYNALGGPPDELMTFSSPQDFFEVYVATNSPTVTINFYNVGRLFSILVFPVVPNAWNHVMYGGMYDQVGVVGGRVMQLDDLSFGPAVTPTPEPATLVLLGTGLLGVFMVGRRRGSLGSGAHESRAVESGDDGI